MLSEKTIKLLKESETISNEEYRKRLLKLLEDD